MAVAATVWLSYQFWRLILGSSPVWHTSPTGAIDLRIRHGGVRRWFDGLPVYIEERSTADPPASYVVLWPILGWLPITPARWVWAATTLVAIGWLIHIIVRESGADTPLQRVFVALLPLSMYATGAALGNGQLIVHLLPTLLAGLLLVERGQAKWGEDLLAAALVLLALVKPSVSVPFFWILLLPPDRLRPAGAVVLGYMALTLFAASFQEPGVAELLRDWLSRASRMAASQGVANLHIALAYFGLEEWILPASGLALAGLGLWIYRHRRGDVWHLLGVTAIVARVWTYHRWYDDLLMLLPMVALFRIAKLDPLPGGGDVIAGGLLSLTLLTALAPGGLYLLPPPWNSAYAAGQAIVWIAVLVYLLDRAHRDRPPRRGGAVQ
jgi:hypothetical protein